MSKSYKAQYKRKAKHIQAQKDRITQKKSKPVLTEKEKAEFAEKYGKGGIIKNTLKIWKNSSKTTFITYFPIIVAQALFTALWFISSMMIFIGPISEYGIIARDFLVFFNSMMAAFGIPLILSYLHLRLNLKAGKYYFFNTMKYTLPASFLYVMLNFLNMAITVMFKAELLKEELNTSFYIFLAMVGTVMVASCIAQVVLISRKSKQDALVTKLGLKIENKKK